MQWYFQTMGTTLLSALDMVITKSADLTKDRISKKLLNILRIGAYELIYASQTAEYARVNISG